MGESRDFDEFERQRQEDLKDIGKRGLHRPDAAGVGWYCGNCKNYHALDVHTCPKPPSGGSLRERIERGGGIHNG